MKKKTIRTEFDKKVKEEHKPKVSEKKKAELEAVFAK